MSQHGTARERVARYVQMRAEKPLRGVDPDGITQIHICTEWEAELRLSDIAELLAENERLERHRVYWRDTAKEAMAEAETTRTKLRELASAEPVAWGDTVTGDLEWKKTKWWTSPLIKRPEMPK